jgi:hypothetical protein
MLTPEEAERNLKEGDYFVNKSGPITSKLSPLMQSQGDYEWFELWRIEGGRAVNTKCKTKDGSTRLVSAWVESDLRKIWNRMAFRCPTVFTSNEA